MKEKLYIWVTWLRDILSQDGCRTKIWFKCNGLKESKTQNWADKEREHQDRLGKILSNFPKHLQEKVKNKLEKPKVLKNFPIKIELDDIIIGGRLDAILINGDGILFVVEAKSKDSITALDLIQTRIYVLLLYYKFQARKIYGVVSNGTDYELICSDDFDLAEEFNRIIEQTAFLRDPEPPIPEYVFFGEKLICDYCGYKDCQFKMTAQELLAEL
jgi:hypothetical protein